MEAIKKALGNTPVFVVAYILFLLPTYYLPYLGSNSAVVGVLGAAAGVGVNPAFWWHLGAMLILCFLCWIRGSYIGKAWLVIFPFLATVFDLTPGLSAIPLIPTVMHLLAIILGVINAKAIEPAQQVIPTQMNVPPIIPAIAEVEPVIEGDVSFCPQCGSRVDASDVFCESCGHRLR